MIVVDIILAAGILNLIMGVMVILGWKEKNTSLPFALFSFATFLVGLSDYFIYRMQLPLFDRLSYAAGILIPTFLLAWIYNYSSKHPKLWKTIIIYIFGAVFFILPLSSNLIIFNIQNSPTLGLSDEKGVLFSFYVSFYLFAYIVVLFQLARLWFLERKIAIKRNQIITIFIGFSIYGAAGIFFGLVLPLFGYDKFTDFDILFSIVFAMFTSYAIVRYKWMNMKVIGVELLTILIIATTLMEIISADSLQQQVYKSIVLVILTVLSIFLVKSVLIEIKHKEELQKISDALAIANQRLKELDATKSEFISIASHQLRTPLTAIKGYISLLLEGSYGVVSPQVLDILNKLYSVNNRLVHLVEDLLNVSRIEAGRIQYSFAPTQLEPIIVELVDMFRPTAKDKKLTLEMKLLKNPLPLLTIDPNKIKEVLSNLIDNSLKYTVQGGVTVSLESTSSVARIIVSDTGIGIKPEDKGKLFEKFIRTSETTKMVASGAGLGLYVGKSFIEAHGGKIWAESEGSDKGSQFIIELPFKNPKIHIGTSDEPSHSEKA